MLFRSTIASVPVGLELPPERQMVLGDGHEYERKTSLRLASRGGGIQFYIPPLLGERSLRAWQGRRAEPRFFAGPCETCGRNLRCRLPALSESDGAPAVWFF